MQEETRHSVEDAAGVTETIDFWLGDARDPASHGWPSDPAVSQRWWRGSPALDAQITSRFGARVHEALAGGLTCWEAKPLARLALVILLDQFTRNVFRGKAEAFSGDLRAQALAADALDRGLDTDLPLAGRLFLAMPLMHAEDLALQDRGLAYFSQLANTAPPERRQSIQGSVDSAREHREIIERFGRFPYRNKVLGRVDTAKEVEFLKNGPRFGQ
jgi:uncharacterized protein (DUF924 family)